MYVICAHRAAWVSELGSLLFAGTFQVHPDEEMLRKALKGKTYSKWVG